MSSHKSNTNDEDTMAFERNQQRTSGPTPISIKKNKVPYVWKKGQRIHNNHHLNGTFLPNDEAFFDATLGNLPEFDQYRQFARITSDQRYTQESDGCYGTVYNHTVQYKGQPVWSLETRGFYDKSRTWGQSSTCVIHGGKLRVILLHKGRRNNGEGYNTTEKRVFALSDIIKTSGEIRRQQMEKLQHNIEMTMKKNEQQEKHYQVRPTESFAQQQRY